MQTAATEAETSLGARNFGHVCELILIPLKVQKIITDDEFEKQKKWFENGAKQSDFLLSNIFYKNILL